MAKATEHKMTDRELKVGEMIRAAVTQLTGPLMDKAAAKAAKETADGAEITGRVGIILEVAKLSCDQGWSESEVHWGCQAAAEVKGNDANTAKSIATFCSEMRNVASVKVRDLVPMIYENVTLAWNMEAETAELDKDAPRPLKKFAKRFYHLFVDAIRKTKAGEIWITCPADVVAWAEANDPDQNAGTVAEQLKKIATDLQAIFVQFAHGDIQQCANDLAQIDQKALTAVRTKPDMTGTLPKPPVRTVQPDGTLAAPPTPARSLAAVPRAPAPVATVPASAPEPDDQLIDAAGDIDDLMEVTPAAPRVVALAEAAD